MRKLIIATAIVVASGCSTLGEEAGQVAVIDDSFQLETVKDCRKRGNISVAAGGFGSASRKHKAHNALREAAVEVGGDTVMVTTSDKAFMSDLVVYGRVYDCRLGAKG